MAPSHWTLRSRSPTPRTRHTHARARRRDPFTGAPPKQTKNCVFWGKSWKLENEGTALNQGCWVPPPRPPQCPSNSGGADTPPGCVRPTHLGGPGRSRRGSRRSSETAPLAQQLPAGRPGSPLRPEGQLRGAWPARESRRANAGRPRGSTPAASRSLSGTPSPHTLSFLRPPRAGF